MSQSARCQAALAGEIVAVAPFAAVNALSENVRARSQQNRERKLILSGDVPAMARCVLQCNEYSKLADRWELRSLSANKLIDAWDSSPEANQLPILIAAHAHLAADFAKSDPEKAMLHWTRVALLSTDPRVEAALNSGDYSMGPYSNFAIDAQAYFISMRYRKIANSSSGDKDSMDVCKPQVAWPPAWEYSEAAQWSYGLDLACKFAYDEAFPTHGKSLN